MEQEQSIVHSAVLTLLSHDQDGQMKTLLESIADWEKTHSVQSNTDGFSWYDVHGDPRTLNSLVTRKILNIVFKSNNSCAYRASSLSSIEKALSDFEGSFTQEAKVAEHIPLDLFHIISEHVEKKEILNRSLVADRPVHCLLWGTVASAKTLFLEELERLPNSRFILGSSLTKAGILDVLFNERPRYLVIDEIDKIDDTENLSALLSLMHKGYVTETKYRRHRTARLKTWVFGSANDISRLPKELLSRFVLLRFRDYTDDEFREVSVDVLREQEGVPENLALYIAENVLRELNSRDIRDVVKCSRLLRSKTREEIDYIISILRKQRG